MDNDLLRRSMLREGLGFTIGYTSNKESAENFLYRQIPLGDLHYLIAVVTNPAQQIPAEGLRYIELLKEEIKKSNCCSAI